ncbi:NADPH:quinone oxidoreductase family protein [Ensifer sp. MPMI2T]|nr:NADPH:quinone oxidoreductase family protein [Ensifer sp. MPMI2T]
MANENHHHTSSAMRAWQSKTPGVDAMVLADVPRPSPREGEALVQVAAAAINFSDVLMLDDKYQIRPPRPFIPGQELAGTVVEVGPGCNLKPGDNIASKVEWGAFAEYACVSQTMAMRAPDGVSLIDAAALPVTYTTSYVALTESTKLRANETVLILAAVGGVGVAAIQIACHMGARVIAAVGGGDKVELARSLGAHEAIDYGTENWIENVRSLTKGRGVDVIIDPVGGGTATDALRLLAWEGRYLVVGFASGKIPAIPGNRLLLKRASAIGVYWNHDRDREMLGRVSKGLYAMAEAGALRPHIGGRYTFDELPTALTDLANRKTVGKVIITF